MIEHFGVLTSGGDASGMNAALRAVVRTAAYYKKKISGIQNGYDGLINDEIRELDKRDVSGIIQLGGTILGSARSKEFLTQEGRKKAFENLKNRGIDALIVIGGDGTFTGAKLFQEEFGLPVTGIPGTIDNDLFGTDTTLGYDTATNNAVNAIDKIRDTASSHHRLFFIEVMGRHAGFIAVRCALAGGAEEVMVPEREQSIEDLIKTLQKGVDSRSSSIVIVAEGDEQGGALDIAKKVKEHFDHYDTRVTVLGHIQRGGSPTTFDRVLACRLGVAAVEGMLEGESNVMVGRINAKIVFTPFKEAISRKKDIEEELLRINKILSI